MAKGKDSKKNIKKAPVKNLKEKRAAKEAIRSEKNKKSELQGSYSGGQYCYLLRRLTSFWIYYLF